MVRSNRGGDDLTRNLKRNERIDDLTRTYFTRSSEKKRTYLTRSSEKKRTYPTRSSTKDKRIDDLTRSLKKNKRNYPTRRSTKNKTICNGERTGLRISGDMDTESNHDVLSELSDETVSILSRNVVSLSLSDEHTVLFKCSAISVQLEGPVSGFLTSVSLVKALNDKRKDHDNLKLEVRHGDNVVIGSLGGYDLDHDIAIVNVDNFPGLHGVVFQSLKTFPHKVVSVGRDISGKLIATSGILNFEAARGFPPHMLSTCKISKECEGGPLYDFHGNFLGMNLSSCTEGTLCLPEIRVHDQWLKCLSLERIKLPAHLNSSKETRAGESSNDGMPDSHQEVHKGVLNEDQFGDLESLGYPECPKSMSTDGIILAYKFEEPFGDLYGEGVWRELNETTVSNIHENIVALASFEGEKRFFACTGCFIEWNGCTTILTAASLIRDSCYGKETVKNLTIKVLLPNKNQVDGILQHYNLHYNIALVIVNGYCPSHPAKIEHMWDDNREVLAVGYIFESGKLMASRGRNVRMLSTHDCKFLEYSTCRITKAGIGGPLLDFDGNFVGINFFDEYARGTPFLLWDEVLDILGYFKERRNVMEAGNANYASDLLDWTIAGDSSAKINSWPVPSPIWCRPDALEKKRYKTQVRSWANNNVGLGMD